MLKIWLSLIFCLCLIPLNQYSSAQVISYQPYVDYGGYSDICTNVDITDDFSSVVTPNYTRTTMISYGGTNLITTIVNDTVNPSQTIDLRNYDYFGQYALSNSTLLSTDSLKKVTTYGIHDVRNFTLGLTNIGNKTVTILVPSGIPDSVVVVNNKTGATVSGVDEYDFATNKAIHAFNDQRITLHYHYRDASFNDYDETMTPIRLGPGDSLIRNGVHLESLSYLYSVNHGKIVDIIPTYTVNIGSGNYTMTAVSRFLASTDKGCTMVYLWSKPVDLTVVPESGSSTYPLEQFKSGTPINDIQCKQGFTLLVKASDNSPACVTPNTAQKLAGHGWGSIIKYFIQ